MIANPELINNPDEISARDQPNSFCNGSMKTPIE